MTNTDNDVQNLVVTGGKLLIDGGNQVHNWDSAGFGAYAEKGTPDSWQPTQANETLVKNAEVVIRNANFFGGRATDKTDSTFQFDNAVISLEGDSINKAGMIFAPSAVALNIDNSTLNVKAGNYGSINTSTRAVFLHGTTVNIDGHLAVEKRSKGQSTGEVAIGGSDGLPDLANAGGMEVTGNSSITVGEKGSLTIANRLKFSNSQLTNRGSVTAGDMDVYENGGDTLVENFGTMKVNDLKVRRGTLTNIGTTEFNSLFTTFNAEVNNEGTMKGTDVEMKTGTFTNKGELTADVLKIQADEKGREILPDADAVLNNQGTMNLTSLEMDYGTVTNTGKLTAESITINSGVFNTVSNRKAEGKSAYLDIGDGGVHIEKGARVNLLDLNSSVANSGHDLNQFQLKGNWFLNGGALTYRDGALENIMLGSETEVGGLYLNGADYSFKRMTVNRLGSVAVRPNAFLAVDELHLINLDNERTGNLEVYADGVMRIGRISVEGNLADSQVSNHGTIETSYDNLFVKKGDKYTDASSFAQLIGNDDGTTREIAYTGGYTREQLDLARSHIKNIVFANAYMVPSKGKDFVPVSDVAGILSPNTAVGSDSSTADFSKATDNTLFAVLNFTDKVMGDVTLTGNTQKAVTLTGKDGTLITAASDKVAKVSFEGGNFVLGSEGSRNSLAFDASVNGSLTTEGSMRLQGVDLGTDSSMTVNGDTVADYVAGGTVNVRGSLAVAGAKPASVQQKTREAVSQNDKPYEVESSYVVYDKDEVDNSVMGKAALAFSDKPESAFADAAAVMKALDWDDEVLVLNRRIDLGANNIYLGQDSKANESGVLGAGDSTVIVDLQAVARDDALHNYASNTPLVNANKGQIGRFVFTNLTPEVFKKQGGVDKVASSATESAPHFFCEFFVFIGISGGFVD